MIPQIGKAVQLGGKNGAAYAAIIVSIEPDTVTLHVFYPPEPGLVDGKMMGVPYASTLTEDCWSPIP